MATMEDKLDALSRAADERGLTPVSWWIGRAHHDTVVEELDDGRLELEAGRLTAIDGLEVKVLTESPQRLALWCEEGALDL